MRPRPEETEGWAETVDRGGVSARAVRADAVEQEARARVAETADAAETAGTSGSTTQDQYPLSCAIRPHWQVGKVASTGWVARAELAGPAGRAGRAHSARARTALPARRQRDRTTDGPVTPGRQDDS